MLESLRNDCFFSGYSPLDSDSDLDLDLGLYYLTIFIEYKA